MDHGFVQVRKQARSITLILFLGVILATFSHAGDAGYHIVKRIKLEGEQGWDYLTVDSAARRLYVSRSTHVLVLDLEHDRLVGEITNTPGVHGIALAPKLNRGFTSNGKAHSATIFDLKTLRYSERSKRGKIRMRSCMTPPQIGSSPLTEKATTRPCLTPLRPQWSAPLRSAEGLSLLKRTAGGPST